MMLILQRFLAHLAHRGFRMFEILAEKSILIVCIEPSSKKIAYILLRMSHHYVSIAIKAFCRFE